MSLHDICCHVQAYELHRIHHHDHFPSLQSIHQMHNAKFNSELAIEMYFYYKDLTFGPITIPSTTTIFTGAASTSVSLEVEDGAVSSGSIISGVALYL